MSRLAKDLMELRAIRGTGHGALVEHLLREIAFFLIAAGVRAEFAGASHD